MNKYENQKVILENSDTYRFGPEREPESLLNPELLKAGQIIVEKNKVTLLNVDSENELIVLHFDPERRSIYYNGHRIEYLMTHFDLQKSLGLFLDLSKKSKLISDEVKELLAESIESIKKSH